MGQGLTLDLPSLAVGVVVGGVVGGVCGWFARRPASPAPVQAPPDTEQATAERAVAMPVVDATAPEVLGFDEAVSAALASGWGGSLPAGRHLARELSEGEAGARRAARALEQAARRGVSTRDDLFARQLAVDRVWRAAADIARLHGLELRVEAPRAVGPQHVEHWIIDEELARRVGASLPGGFVQPLLVLRPALLRDDRVLLEGVVV